MQSCFSALMISIVTIREIQLRGQTSYSIVTVTEVVVQNRSYNY